MDGLPAVVDVELAVDVVQVFFYGFRRNKQFDSNLFILQSLRQQIQDIEFAIRERLDNGLGAQGGRMGDCTSPNTCPFTKHSLK